MPAYCVDSRSAARHHTLQGFGGSGGRGSRLGCRLGSSYQKAPRSEPNFAKLTVSTPTKSTICDRSGYLDRARDLGTESCIAVHSKSLNAARGRTRRTRPGAVAATQRPHSPCGQCSTSVVPYFQYI